MSEPNTFYINFNTEADVGKLQAVKVTIELEKIVDLERTLNVALADHPLYPELQQYVKANPR